MASREHKKVSAIVVLAVLLVVLVIIFGADAGISPSESSLPGPEYNPTAGWTVEDYNTYMDKLDAMNGNAPKMTREEMEAQMEQLDKVFKN